MSSRSIRFQRIKRYGIMSAPAIGGISASIITRDPIFIPVGLAGSGIMTASSVDFLLDEPIYFKKRKKKKKKGKKKKSRR